MDLQKLATKFTKRNPGHGPVENGHVDPKPYKSYWSNGVFQGYDNRVWKYYSVPDDVRTEWLKEPEEVIYNQSFLNSLFQEFGKQLDGSSDRIRNDLRRSFHLQITQRPARGIEIPDVPPALKNYHDRMSGRYQKPEWHGYFGVEVLPASIFYETHGFQQKVLRYIDMWQNPDKLQWEIFQEDFAFLDSKMNDFGFRQLDFKGNGDARSYELGQRDFVQLTAWHGEESPEYGVEQRLETTRMIEPQHGYSVSVPRWGEVVFHALQPQDANRMRDPLDESTRWAVPLYRPDSNVVLVSVRGQVRSLKVSDNLLDFKKNHRLEASGKNATESDLELNTARVMENARRMVREDFPVLDNVEIIIGTRYQKNRSIKLSEMVAPYSLNAINIVGRQNRGVLTSIPGYPEQVMPIPRGNRKRSELSNSMLPGVLAMSGVLANTRQCAPSGILIGLSDARYQYKEIFTEPDGPYKYSKPPAMLVTGRTGAGKTQQLLQMACQLCYWGLPVVFLNPKKDATLKPTFDYLEGTTISMNRQYLESNPGLFDPMFFLDDRKEVASVLADAIFLANRMYSDAGSSASQRRSQIQSELQDRAVDLRNNCSYDIIFGNTDAGTGPIGDEEIINFVKNKMNVSPFWTAFISKVPMKSSLREKLKGGKPLLIEWDGEMQLPAASVPKNEYTEKHVDSVLSVNAAFIYSSAIIGGTGGAIIVDESWALKSSEEATQILMKGGREWRQRNIMLIMATQRIVDWTKEGGDTTGNSNLNAFFARYLFMAIAPNDKEDLKAYYEITGLPDNKRNTYYITHAGVGGEGGKGNIVPRAYYVDQVHGWDGGIICGPWPELELNLGRTDKEGEALRRKSSGGIQKTRKGEVSDGYQGVLREIVSHDLDQEFSSDDNKMQPAYEEGSG